MAERQTRSPRTRRGSWNGGKKEEEEGKSPLVPEGTGSRDVRGEEIYVAPDWIVLTRSRRLLFALPRFSPELSSPFTFSLPSRFSPPLLRPFSIRIYTNRGSNATVSDRARLWNLILPRFRVRERFFLMDFIVFNNNNNDNKNQSRQILRSEKKNEKHKRYV